jgi:FdhE protein
VAAFHDERLRDLGERPAADVSIDLDAETARAAVRAGTPLLQAGRLALDPQEVQDELRRVARNLSETSEPRTGGHRAAEIIATAPIDVMPLLGPALDGDRQAIEREAFRLQLDPEPLQRMLDLALQPFLWEVTAQAALLADLDQWDRGYCPVCGAWPALAELVGPEKRRVLRCVRCAAGWSWGMLLCPYCGNDDHRTLRVLMEEGSSERIDICERCSGYLKAVTAYLPSSGAKLVAEDVATADLDLIATSRGYTRPGNVDVTTAGIPRSSRTTEGA